MKSPIVLISLFLPFLVAFFIDYTISANVFFGNIVIMCLSFYFLKKFNLVNPHYYSILIFLTFVSIFALLSYNDSISIGSNSLPYVPGGDGESYFSQASYLSKGNPLDAPDLITLNYLGYQIVLAFWFKILGVNLFNGLLLNYAFLIFSLIFLSITTYLLTNNKIISYYTLLLSLFCSHFIASGILLLKDVYILFAFSLFLFSVVKYNLGGKSPLLIFNFLFSIIIIGSLRLPFLSVLVLILLIFASKNKIKNILLIGVLSLSTFITIPFFLSLTNRNIDEKEVTGVVLETSFVENSLTEGSKGGAVDQLIGGYTSKPVIQRVITLPIPFIIQFVTPFNFWETKFISDHIWYFVTNQLNIIWYGFIGIHIFLVILNHSHLKYFKLNKLFYLGLSLYTLMAFIYGGAVPRYAMPFILFMMPSMGNLLFLGKSFHKLKQNILKFYLWYYGLAVFLIVFYIFFKLL